MSSKTELPDHIFLAYAVWIAPGNEWKAVHWVFFQSCLFCANVLFLADVLASYLHQEKR